MSREVFRFMSDIELGKLLDGETLVNNCRHKGFTDSVGFCFMDTDDVTPEEAYKFLSGIVSNDVCVVFKTTKPLVASHGVYADPYGSFFSTIRMPEYCTTKYSLKDFEIVRVAFHFHAGDEEWKWNVCCQSCHLIEKDGTRHADLKRETNTVS